MKKNKNVDEAQGAENTPTERKPSAMYTIKQLSAVVKKIETMNMARPEELATLKSINKAMLNRWIGLEIEIA